MRADDAWSTGEPGFDWCGHCKKRRGLNIEKKECGHEFPTLGSINDLSGLESVKCYCVVPDVKKMTRNLKLKPKQEDLF